MFHSISWTFHSVLGVQSSAFSQSCTVCTSIHSAHPGCSEAHHSQLPLHDFVPMARAMRASTVHVVSFMRSKAKQATSQIRWDLCWRQPMVRRFHSRTPGLQIILKSRVADYVCRTRGASRYCLVAKVKNYFPPELRAV